MVKISKDTPLAELTFRKYEKPNSLKDRELVRKLCLSLGLLQPGDSRDVVVDVFQVILEAEEPISSLEVEKRVKKNRENKGLEQLGVAGSNIRRQLLRLRSLFLVEKTGSLYRINEGASLKELFSDKIEKYYLDSIMARVREYIDRADKFFKR